MVVTAPPTAPRTIEPRIARDLEAICLRCLAKKADERYPSASALVKDLTRFLDGYAVEAERKDKGSATVQIPSKNQVTETVLQDPGKTRPYPKADGGADDVGASNSPTTLAMPEGARPSSSSARTWWQFWKRPNS
jgi:hypothetical protein